MRCFCSPLLCTSSQWHPPPSGQWFPYTPDRGLSWISLLGLYSVPANSGTISTVLEARREWGKQSLAPCLPAPQIPPGAAALPSPSLPGCLRQLLGTTGMCIPSCSQQVLHLAQSSSLKIGKEVERWDAAAGGEQPGKEGPCGSAQSIQAR